MHPTPSRGDPSTLVPTDRQIADWLSLLVEPDQIVEVRAPQFLAPGRKQTKNTFKRFVAGDCLAIAQEALRLSGRAPGVYFTLNPLRGDIPPKQAARDTDVIRRRSLLIDCDPVRTGVVSSGDDEKEASLALALAIRDFLRARGWPEPVLCDSGNGYHLLYRIDLPGDDGGLVKRVLDALAAKFDTPAVKVDVKVGNASRICKLYGTLVRKGEDTPERPHRYCGVLEIPGEFNVVSEELLGALVVELAPPALDLDAEVERKRDRQEASANGKVKPKPRAEDNGHVPPGVEKRAIAYLAKCEPAIETQHGHDKLFKAACKVGPGFNLPPPVLAQLLRVHYNPRCKPPWSEEELLHKVDDAYKVEPRRGWFLEDDGREFILGKAGLPASCATNSKLWLEANRPAGSIRLDTFRRAILIGGEPLTDRTIVDLAMEIEASLSVPWAQDHIRSAIIHLAHRDEFSSLALYLGSLEWDGEPRIESFFSDHFGVADDEYHREVARVFFLSAVARGLRPGCKVDTVPLLIAPQGAGKSRSVAALCPDPEWFTDQLNGNLGDKDASIDLLGKFIVELSELSAMRKSELEPTKAFLSRTTDHFRMPFGKLSEDFPRTCVFVATTNEDTPLQDQENRRFHPVYVGPGPIDVRAIGDARDQLWAEAVHRVKAGEEWWTTSDERLVEIRDQGWTARASDAWEEILTENLSTIDRTTVVEAARKLGITYDRLGKSEQTRIGYALRAIGFVGKRNPKPPRERYYERDPSNL